MPIWKGDTYWCDNAALARFLDIALLITVVRINGLLLLRVEDGELRYIGDLLNMLVVVAMLVLTRDSQLISGLCVRNSIVLLLSWR